MEYFVVIDPGLILPMNVVDDYLAKEDKDKLIAAASKLGYKILCCARTHAGNWRNHLSSHSPQIAVAQRNFCAVHGLVAVLSYTEALQRKLDPLSVVMYAVVKVPFEVEVEISEHDSGSQIKFTAGKMGTVLESVDFSSKRAAS